MSNFQTTTTFLQNKKTSRGPIPHAKMVVRAGIFFYEDSKIWLTYVPKRIFISIFFCEKLCNSKKTRFKRAKSARQCECYPGGGKPLGNAFFFLSFYTKTSVLGSKICGFLVILMSIWWFPSSYACFLPHMRILKLYNVESCVILKHIFLQNDPHIPNK